LTAKNQGRKSIFASDNALDFFLIIWRNHPRWGSASGSVGGSSGVSIKNMADIDRLSRVGGASNVPWDIVRHEFSHPLFGGNDYHNAGSGNNFDRTFMSNVMGWSMMSSTDKSGEGWNAWDLHRLGWKHNTNQLFISSRNDNNNEISGDLIYNQLLDNNGTSNNDDVFLLRDFATYGDAIRIELPFLQSENQEMKKQYLWLENHQGLASNIDLKSASRAGIYAYVQVGKDDTSNFEGLANYTAPLTKLGNYDYIYTNHQGEYADINITKGVNDNPFTGYHHLMWQANDTENDGDIKRREYILPRHIIIDETPLPITAYNLDFAAFWGTCEDAFLPGDKMNLSTNPAPVSLMTYRTKQFDDLAPYLVNENNQGILNDSSSYNRNIYLNNIGIEIVEERPNPNGHGNDMVVRIKWNENAITEDVRWCGSMVASSGVHLFFYDQNTFIDRSMTPTIPYAEPDGIFSLPSSLTLKNGSITEIREGSNFYIRDNSSLNVDYGAYFKVINTKPWLNTPPLLNIEENASALISTNLAELSGTDSKIIVIGEM